jgi:multisubunit Na+/H+ antiporter MnhG subunit
VLLRRPFVQFGIKAVLIALVLLITNSLLTHATARAARIRRFGALDHPGGGRRGGGAAPTP